MSGIIDYVENLTDGEVYNELKKHGFPAGPVVASTRRLYKRKLSEILEGIHDHSEEKPLQEADELEEQLTQPIRMGGSIGKSKWGYEHKQEEPRVETGLSHIHPFYRHDEAKLGKLSSSLSDTFYTSSRDQRKDDLRPRSSWSSSYCGTERGLEHDDDNGKPSPSWLSMDVNSSAPQPSTSSPWRTYGSSRDDSFRKTQHTVFTQVTEGSPGYSARQRRTFTDSSPAARQEMALRYRLTGLSNEKTSLLNRNTEKQRKQSVNLMLRLVLFITLVLAAVTLSYMVYNAWSENDPYRQIEEDVLKIIEGRKSDFQE